MLSNVSKILVVDDERLNIQLLFEGLSDEYDILATSTGAEAIRVAQEQLPDLILLDIMLGDVSGYEVCKTLKLHPTTADIPIIFVTGKDTAEEEMIGLELGAVDYFSKPFNIALVRIRIRKQIELAQKTAMLEHLSMVDGLTGVANRRQFDEKLAESIRYVDRNHRGLSLLLIDIDYFKQYNDIYGHVKGDDVLKKVARTLSNGASRPMDFVARYGGEEFAVLLTDASHEEGLLVAEKLRALVENKNIVHQGSNFEHLTISVGVTYIDSSHIAKINSKEFIEDADQCLYMAKSQGRNQVITSTLIID
jgi:diguanylate cyclase (GGDEF)-like protein